MHIEAYRYLFLAAASASSQMRWFKHGFAQSLYNLFAQSSLTVRSQPTVCTDEIREAMLFMVGDVHYSSSSQALLRRIRLAADVQELWFLRSGLMSALAQTEGESAARERVAQLDPLFGDQVPRGTARIGLRAG
ncbi:MAG: hypothetical protein J0H69_00545 [Burkholderiales bacterium]|nr:hypothetical protein [Burkholderiales bacterium]